MRAAAETLDCDVKWYQDIKTTVITKDNGDTIKITLDSDIMTVNGEQVKMDTTALLKGDRTLYPCLIYSRGSGTDS